MSVNKRECKKYADPMLTFRKNDGLLLAAQIGYIVRSAVKNIAGRRALILYFYKRDKIAEGFTAPEYTLFQYRDDYATLQRTENGVFKWREASLENMGSGYGRFVNRCAFYRQSDEQRVSRYCKDQRCTGFSALEWLQTGIMRKRLNARIKARDLKIIERMKPVPPAPRDLKGMIHRETLPQYIFYDYARGPKPMRGYCTACRHDISVSGARHNSAGKCPRCGRAVTFKASGRAKNVWDRTTVQVLQKTQKKELVLRIFKVYNNLRNWRESNLSVWENARFFIRWNEDNKVGCDAYYYAYGGSRLTNWKNGERPRMSSYQENFECVVCGYLYLNNLDDAFAGTPWQYSQLGRFYGIDRKPMEVMPYMSAYHKYPAIEYLVKLGLTELASEVIYGYNTSKIINASGKNLREVLGVGPEDLPVLQKINADLHQMNLYKCLKKQGVKADESLLTWYRRCGIASTDDVLQALSHTTPGRLMRYIDEKYEQLKDVKTAYGTRRFEKANRVLSEYGDYLRLGSGLKYDFSDSFVLFPRNLPEAHDQASKLYNTKKDEIYNRCIREAYQSLMDQYRFTKEGLTLIPPKTAREIVSEGHSLHHCVHTYVDQVANGKCVILFVRKTDSVKKPFFTVELKDGRVAQIRGQDNCAPTPEVEKFLQVWEQKKLQPVSAAA